MRFTTPNVIIVFSNKYPDTRGVSEDRWMVFKINTKMELKEVTDSSPGVKKRKKIVNEDSDEGGWQEVTDSSSGVKKRKKMDNEDSDEGGWQTDDDY